ncbi:MAG TPA: AbrB family transcriptional regulator [Bauldia sp.]|nr:AbrB family transcriptional regulator [Bauldia sp.]
MDIARWLRLAGTVVIGAAGGAVADWLGLPAAWMSGSMIAVTIASLAGLDTRLPLRLMNVVFLGIGIALGVGVTPEVVHGIVLWSVGLVGLGLSVVACVWVVQVFLVRVAGWDRDTAFFSALPGALSYVLAVAADSRADIRKVATSQSIRVFLLVAVLPSLIVSVAPEGSAMPAKPPAPVTELVVLVVAGVAVALLFRRLRVPAAWLTGALAASAILHGTGTFAGSLPAPAVIVVFVLLGALVGSRFAGSSLALIARIGLASLGAFVLAMAVSIAFSAAVSALVGTPLDQVLVAFAPGGLDAMTTLAVALNMDSAFVAAHQLARFAGIALTLPFLARGALARASADEETRD